VDGGMRITPPGAVQDAWRPGRSSRRIQSRCWFTSGEVADPMLRILFDRARSGSRRFGRSDPHRVCLAIEGGGMRGAVSAGMCVSLEAVGLVPAFDRDYGVSAGALNAWATAVGQAALGVTHYQDAVSYGVINRMRPLVGRPVIDSELF
jgi:predicted acylesterase/phospholipase RssA